jgi:hypothetical protein
LKHQQRSIGSEPLMHEANQRPAGIDSGWPSFLHEDVSIDGHAAKEFRHSAEEGQGKNISSDTNLNHLFMQIIPLSV